MRRPNDGRDSAELREVIRTVRRRWRTRHLLRGLLLTAGAGLAALLIVRIGLDHLALTPAAAVGLSFAIYLGVIAVAAWSLLPPLLRRVDDRQVALYLEEHEPGLQAEILTAVETLEADPGAGLDPFLVELVHSAVARARQVEGGRRVDREPLRRLSWASGVGAVVVFFLLVADPLGIRTSLPELVQPWTAVQAAAPMAILIAPGDTTVPRGAELRFSARLQGFDSERVEVAFRRGSETRWDRWPMMADEAAPGDAAAPGPDAPAADARAASGREHRFVLFEVDEPLEYFVEAEGVRTGVHRVEVVDLPYVSSLALEIHPPAYTGMPVEEVEAGGDLAVLPGTRVRLRADPTLPVPTGRIVIEGADPIALSRTEDGAFEGEFVVERAGFYRIDLEEAGGRVHRGTPDYVIDVLEDLPPVVSFARPGRDLRATAVEEVFVEARAADDHGIALLEIVYSVNGGDPIRVPLLDGEGGRLAQVSAGHTFFLEEYDLVPGDLVSYHARALDVGPGAAEREARTDLFFIQVQPFDREFRQADEQPGGMQGDGDGDGDQQGGQLSSRQRDIVTATFNVQRNRRSYDPEELEEAITTIALAQDRLRDEVETLVVRLMERGVAADPEMRQVADALPAAAEAMAEAFGFLDEGQLEEALSPEQRALQHLLRAEAAFREVQVSQGAPEQGGGGGGDAGEDLADYFDIEMDRMRNQYESLERGEREAAARQLDEAQERLQELARRQQQESERLRRAAEQLPAGAANAGGDSQRRLAEETEEMARQLERLAREQSSPEMAETAQRLRQAAEAMRRSAASRDERGVGQAEEAADALEDARRLLDRSRSESAQRDIDAVEDRTRRALERQERIQEAVERIPEDATFAERRAAAEALGEQKEDLRAEVEGLQQELRRLSREAGDGDREAAQGLREAADAIRDGNISDRIEFSRAMAGSARPEQARQFEQEITDRLRDVAERVSEAAGAMGEGTGDGARELMDRTRDLLRGAESMQERARRAGEDPGQGERGEQGEGGRGAPDAETVRQLQREAEQRAREAEAIANAMEAGAGAERGSETGGGVGRSGVDPEVMGRVVNAFRSLTTGDPYGDARALEAVQREIVESLRELDFVLRRQFAGTARDEAVVAGSGEVPESYRALVEEYFRNLARPRP